MLQVAQTSVCVFLATDHRLKSVLLVSLRRS